MKTKLFLIGFIALILQIQSFSALAQDSIYDFKDISIAEETASNIQSQIKALAQDLSDPAVVRDTATDLLRQVKAGAQIDEYHFLWLPYALLKGAYADSNTGLSQENEFTVAINTLDFLKSQGNVGDWYYTELGQFKMEVFRTASNTAAWSLRHSDPKRALVFVEEALEHARPEDNHIRDTKVRILLNLGKKDEAYTIVKAVLDEEPDFSDFQDLKVNPEYLTWLKK